jgi:hypothetical protein
MAASQPLPSWYTPEEPAATMTPAPRQVQGNPIAPTALPSWYTPEPESVTVSADKPESFGDQVGDLAANVGTGVARIPGAIIGLPHMLNHTLNWLVAQSQNAGTQAKVLWNGKPAAENEWRTGADIDATDPFAKHTLSSEEVDNGLFKHVISPIAGHEVKPYEPTSFIGKLLQAAVTGAGAGVLDPAAILGAAKGGATAAAALKGAMTGAGGRAVKTAIAADVANATQQAYPDEPGLAAGAALLAHGGAGAAAEGATRGYRTFVEPIHKPVRGGEVLAGKSLAGSIEAPVDHTQPGLANPSRADIEHATDATRSAVGDIGDGLDDYTAGGNVRSALQGRKDALVAGRSAEAGENYEAFRNEQPLEGAKLAPFMQAPAFQAAVKAASRGRLNRGQSPLTGFWDFNAAGDPVLKPNAAVPPDVLQRIKGALDDDISSAKGNVERGDLMDLRDRFVNFLDQQYSNTYPKARNDFAGASRPLDPLTEGLPGKVLDGDKQFNRQTYTMPQDKIAGTFLQSKALRSDFDSLIKAYGGDKKAALSNLEENLANKVQGAIAGDGTLSLDAFNRSVRPYTKALQMWFPELSQKFSTAEAAQRTLETLKGQKEITADIGAGSLRGDDGFITGSTLSRWLDRNEAKLAKTQSKAAVMRLHQIAKSLPDTPGAGAEAAVETAPMVVGGALGGLEGGVLGGITHKIPAYLAGPRLAKFRDAYSAAIERAVTDPTAAQQLVDLAAKRGGQQSIVQVLKENAKKAALATPLAVQAGKLPAGN